MSYALQANFNGGADGDSAAGAQAIGSLALNSSGSLDSGVSLVKTGAGRARLSGTITGGNFWGTILYGPANVQTSYRTRIKFQHPAGTIPTPDLETWTILRANTNSLNGYHMGHYAAGGAGQWYLYKVNGGSGVPVLTGGTFTGADVTESVAAGSNPEYFVDDLGDIAGVATFKLYRGATLLRTWTDSAPLANTKRSALRADNLVAAAGAASEVDEFDSFDLVSDLAIDNLDVTFTGPDSAQLGMAPSGGSSPYTKSWYEVPDATTPSSGGTLIVGETGTTVDISGLTSSWRYFRAHVIDNDANEVDSPVRALKATAADPLKIVLIGDSTFTGDTATHTSTMDDLMNGLLQTMHGHRKLQIVNAAVAGTQTSDWQTDQSPYISMLAMVGGDLTGRIAVVYLGVNDGRSENGPVTADNYHTRLLGVVTGLLADGADMVLLSYPNFTEPGPYTPDPSVIFGEAMFDTQVAYQAKIDLIISGDPTHVFPGDQTSFEEFVMLAKTYSRDHLHPNNLGIAMMAGNTLAAIYAQTDPPPPGGGSGPANFWG